jgi:hypothetical protein
VVVNDVTDGEGRRVVGGAALALPEERRGDAVDLTAGVQNDGVDSRKRRRVRGDGRDHGGLPLGAVVLAVVDVHVVGEAVRVRRRVLTAGVPGERDADLVREQQLHQLELVESLASAVAASVVVLVGQQLEVLGERAEVDDGVALRRVHEGVLVPAGDLREGRGDEAGDGSHGGEKDGRQHKKRQPSSR